MVFPHSGGASQHHEASGSRQARDKGEVSKARPVDLRVFLLRAALFGLGLGLVSLATLFDEHCDV